MKIVSFKAAKAIKEAGYPQGNTPYQYITKNYDTFKEGDVIDAFYENWAGNNVIDAPYAIEVWLWLWRTKSLVIDVMEDINTFSYIHCSREHLLADDPEEAIIEAIEYIVENDLIK